MKLSQSKCHGFTFYRSSWKQWQRQWEWEWECEIACIWRVSYAEPPNVFRKVYNAMAESDGFFMVFICGRLSSIGEEKQQNVSIDDDNNQTTYTANECTRKLTAT